MKRRIFPAAPRGSIFASNISPKTGLCSESGAAALPLHDARRARHALRMRELFGDAAEQDRKQAKAAEKTLAMQREKRERENSLWLPPPAPQASHSLGGRLRKSI